MPETIIEKAKNKFLQTVNDFGSDPYHLLPHVPEVEKWVRHIATKYPQVDLEIAILGAWLHDLGHYPIPTEVDHAIRSEEQARIFLEQEAYPADKLAQVLHCVRAHRCRDLAPESLEAKIVACADSASHMTDSMYFSMAKDDKESGGEFRVYAKMERDYRDVAFFPEVREELESIHQAWYELMKSYERISLE
ncbi:MAG: HD domain-containing protein [Candidatus Falkowbacteria bacterium]|nr:HD domain-containing protein [Candidatus Falkowbacteria bacterium]